MDERLYMCRTHWICDIFFKKVNVWGSLKSKYTNCQIININISTYIDKYNLGPLADM